MQTPIRYLLCALIALCASAPRPLSAREREVRVLYFNDAHDPYMVQTRAGRLGGAARMKHVADSIRARHPGAILIFGGDLGGGTLTGKLFRGSIMVDYLNRIGVDYANYGQHDFDYGLDNTIELTKRSSFRWISSNTATTDGSRIPGSCPFVVHRTEGLSVGILGLVDKVNTSSPHSGILQRDLIGSAKEAIRRMGAVDFVIAVTQMEHPLNEELLTACPEIDLILSEESSQYETRVSYVGKTPIVDGCGNMGHLVEVTLYPDGRVPFLAVHPLTADVTPDGELEESVRELQKSIDDRLGQVITSLPFASISSRHRVGQLAAEAFRHYYRTDLAMVQGGGIRADLTDSLLTLKDIYSILPYENRVVPVRLTGRELTHLLQIALHDAEAPALAGAEVSLTEEDEVRLLLRGKEIDPAESYSIALTDYVVGGGGPFAKIPAHKFILPIEETATDSDILLRYLSGDR